ncbi:MAG: hypothetical protein EAZ53_08910 [Bacteroidetes bacterium]|nr:MAG: hypothetical protein EAZ53_08910 [Bacteroidota bacterium]
MQEDYYQSKLYPLQDKVLKIIEHNGTDFYLTGGTAISRAYFNHRFSDDLDFFVNHNPDFLNEFKSIYSLFKDFDIKTSTLSESFARVFITEGDCVLKMDFVNDVKFRKGEVIPTPLFYRTDTVLNILSNKISALTRDEPKDISDILVISSNTNFNWIEIIDDAKNKDMSVDELEIVKTLTNFDINRLKSIHWLYDIDIFKMENQLNIIIQDILMGSQNSLCLTY